MEWIAIRDRFPEKFSEVIVCTNEGRVKSAIYMGDGKFNTFMPIVYWMPMPEAPKFENTEKVIEPIKKKRGRPKKS